MNLPPLVWTLLLIAAVSGCHHPASKKQQPVIPSRDSLVEVRHVDEQDRKKSYEEVEHDLQRDSVRLATALENALAIANRNLQKERFTTVYEFVLDSIPVTVDVNIDCHFSNQPQLIIKRNNLQQIYFDIYTKGKNGFRKILSHQQWALEYINDTIQDINGDGAKDFVVNWYGSAGCCLKAWSSIYLFRPDTKTSSEKFMFINPTFSPQEKIIRGICYGHPGDTEMYKYKWNGEKIDTIEYVAYETNKKGERTGRITLSTARAYHKNKITKVVNAVPPEYQKIYGYDWFTGKW